ncbi:MAG: ABC transporter substrate-binding protein, partial [Acidobacteria bacterium]|nr:ABC transporter substrate-binding protein [Acidobacteriota bacterium]
MDTLFGAIRYAFRQFNQSRIFTIAAVLTLALGIGGTTAIFTLIDALMLRSLPVADPGRLYRIGDGNDCCVEGGPQDRWGMYSFPLFEVLTAQAPEFEQIAAFEAGGGQMSVRRERVETAARPLRSEYVTGNYFTTLGIGAFAGRVLIPDDDRPAAPPVIVLSHHTWSGTYGGDPSIVNST